MALNTKVERWLIGLIGVVAIAIIAVIVLLARPSSTSSVKTGSSGPASTSAAAGSANTTPGSGSATGTGTGSHSGSGSGTTTPVASPTPTTPPPPHFDTPQAAMTYLAAAWNAHNTVDLDHVTNPAARAQLDAMRSEAVDLRLNHCDPRPQGDYLCYFDHNYPSGTSTTLPGGIGHSVFIAGPAKTPGWYMTVFISCG